MGGATPILTSSSNSSISYIMIGATALGVVCAVVGAYLLIRMKKRQQI
jgi:cell division protein FtsN